MSPRNPFVARLRGFRIIDLVFLAVLLTVAVGSYAFKTLEIEQGTDTRAVEDRIVEEQKQIRLLHAEISHLEDPGRIERLSTSFLGMGRIEPDHEIGIADLARIAKAPPPPAPAAGKQP